MSHVKAVDVAAYINNKIGDVDKQKLQKLTYYAQAWSLTWFGSPLFDDPINSCRYGSVIPSVFDASEQGISTVGDVKALSDDQVKIIEAILDFYGDKTAEELADLTDSEDLWLETGGDCHDARSYEVMSHKSMISYYTKLSLQGGVVPQAPVLDFVEMKDEEWAQSMAAVLRDHAHVLEWLADK